MREITSIYWWDSYRELKIRLEPAQGVPDFIPTDPSILVEHRPGRFDHGTGNVIGSKMHYWIWSPYQPDVWKCLPTELGAWRAVKAILDGKVKP